MFLRLLGIMVLFSAWGCESLSMNHRSSDATQSGQPKLTLTSLSKSPTLDSSNLTDRMVIPEETEEFASKTQAEGRAIPDNLFSF